MMIDLSALPMPMAAPAAAPAVAPMPGAELAVLSALSADSTIASTALPPAEMFEQWLARLPDAGMPMPETTAADVASEPGAELAAPTGTDASSLPWLWSPPLSLPPVAQTLTPETLAQGLSDRQAPALAAPAGEPGVSLPPNVIQDLPALADITAIAAAVDAPMLDTEPALLPLAAPQASTPVEARAPQPAPQLVDLTLFDLPDDAGGGEDLQIEWQPPLQAARLQLRPDALGTLDVDIRMDGTQAYVQIRSDEMAARLAVQSSLSQMAELLAGQGLQLAQADVGPRRQGQGSASPHPQKADADTPREATAPARPSLRRSNGLVDRYA